MRGLTVTELLRAVPGSRGVWRGVFSRDTTPRRVGARPAAYVFNTHPHGREGEHWVAVYVGRGGRGEYFDSFGFPPYHREFRAFLDKHTSRWKYNEKRVQGLLAETCGHFCVYFLAHKFHGLSMKSIMKRFGENTRANDVIVRNFVKRLSAKKKKKPKKKRL
jgi:hypothetical protein